jgi:hypothetical protein
MNWKPDSGVVAVVVRIIPAPPDLLSANYLGEPDCGMPSTCFHLEDELYPRKVDALFPNQKADALQQQQVVFGVKPDVRVSSRRGEQSFAFHYPERLRIHSEQTSSHANCVHWFIGTV